MMVTKNGHGEIADLQTVSQFEPNETQTACGPFAVALNRFAGQPGKGPRATAEGIDQYADGLFDGIFGSHDIAQESGIVPDTMHTLLLQAGLHYQDLTMISDSSEQASDIAAIKAALDQGYTVIAEIHESSVQDRSTDFQGNPYPWGGDWWHYITYSGYTDSGLLVHDPANIVGQLNGQNTPRPQPRVYDSASIQNRWATIVWHDWLPMMPPNFDPTKQTINSNPAPPTAQGGTPMTGIPAGWRDDGRTLTAPNGIAITQGFRDYILAHSWDTGNVPLTPAMGLNPVELSNPALGGGTVQRFRDGNLEWTSQRGVFPGWTGQELVATIAILKDSQQKLTALQDAWNKLVPEKDALITENTQLKAQIADLQAKPAIQLLQQQLDIAQAKLQQISTIIHA